MVQCLYNNIGAFDCRLGGIHHPLPPSTPVNRFVLTLSSLRNVGPNSPPLCTRMHFVGPSTGEGLFRSSYAAAKLNLSNSRHSLDIFTIEALHMTMLQFVHKMYGMIVECLCGVEYCGDLVLSVRLQLQRSGYHTC
jgi:hypothetical protein